MTGRVMNVLTSMGFTLAQDQKRQILLLDKEFAECKAQVHALTSERDALRAQVEPLKREVERLKKESEQQSTPSHDDLDDMAENLLEALANCNGRVPKNEVVKIFSLSLAKSDYYFDVLRERNFIIQTMTGARGACYGATAEGRKYLAKKGKL